MNKDFCIFILTHGRPEKVLTYKTLQKCGCTYPIYFIIDNEDKTAQKYYENFGKENVIMFDKLAISKTFDTADNFDNRKCIVYARNACFDIAEKLGYTYFLQLDDDYTAFSFMYDAENNFKQKNIKNFNKTIDIFLDYYKNINVKSICFFQRGDLIGGINNFALRTGKYPFQKRKAMNSFFCSTQRKFKFVGRINEDVNTYSKNGSVGDIFMTIPVISLNQLTTQANKGGMTETYLDGGTYLKSFYTILYKPDSYVISLMGKVHERLHHIPTWENVCPKIISENLKK